MDDKVFAYKVFYKDIRKGIISIRDENGEAYFWFSRGMTPLDALQDRGLFCEGETVRFARISVPLDQVTIVNQFVYTAEVTIEETFSIKELILEQAKQQLYGQLSTSTPSLKSFYSRDTLAMSEAKARLTSCGDCSCLSTSGYQSQIVSIAADCSQLSTSGDCAIVASNSDCASISTSGRYVRVLSAGKYPSIAASGDNADILAEGAGAHIVVSGRGAQVAVTGKHSRIMLCNHTCFFKGVAGTYVSSANFDCNCKFIGFIGGCIGEDGLKPDTWYSVKNGKFSESINV